MTADDKRGNWLQNDTIYATIGMRLRAERQRLNLSQQEFAAACGIHRRSQGNYEKDKRQPSAVYWAQAEKAGADVSYVLSGAIVAVGIDLDVFHRRFLRRAFISALGYTPNEYDSFCAHAFEIERRGAGAGTRDEQGAADTEADEYAVQLVVNSPRVTALVESSSAPDPRILGEVIQALDRATLTWGDAFPREKRGRLIAALYRSARALGRIDSAIVADAVGLAL